ncbi:MAG: hypothetical protein WB421_20025 [Terriglobales bacterium]
MDFVKAEIKVESEKEFEGLKSSIIRIFDPNKVEGFLKRMVGKSLRIRDWDGVVAKRLLDQSDEVLAKSGTTSQRLYEALTLSDQAQMREFYLSKIEELAPETRTKFKQLYQYY